MDTDELLEVRGAPRMQREPPPRKVNAILVISLLVLLVALVTGGLSLAAWFNIRDIKSYFSVEERPELSRPINLYWAKQVRVVCSACP